ncbi:hypothetical protein [Variovorax sp.]|uniref:hypothetical protein n=1 Tax=Variovorax sp. TaxID=1871043 RepID=UPI003BAAB5CA
MLIPAGIFKEHCGGDFPSILTVVATSMNAEEREKVANYLASCPIVVASPGIVKSIFDDSVIAGTPSMRTDGDWVWHDTYSYYVRTQKVNVDEDFLGHMRERAYVPLVDAEVDFSTMQFPW